jgi:hypothetical protein
MIANDKRTARTFLELEFGDLASLHEALPEFAMPQPSPTTEEKRASQFPEKRSDSECCGGSDSNRRSSDLAPVPFRAAGYIEPRQT